MINIIFFITIMDKDLIFVTDFLKIESICKWIGFPF